MLSALPSNNSDIARRSRHVSFVHRNRHSDWYTRRNLAQSLFDAERSDDYAGGDSLWLTLDLGSLRYDATCFLVQRTQPGIRGGDPTRSQLRGTGKACEEAFK